MAGDFTLGYMLDISRGKVPSMEELKRIVDVIAPLGYGELELYTENTFAYTGHEAAWRDASPLTARDVRELDDYAFSKGVALVANQNSFGHLERWLEKPEYRHLAEAPNGGARKPWGTFTTGPTALCVTDPRSVELVGSWYDELLPCFRSKLVNIGGDEVYDLNAPDARSAAYIKEVGEDAAYLEFLGKIVREAKKRGATPMVWADFFRKRPAHAAWLKENGVIALDWGYSDAFPFEEVAKRYEALGIRYRLCPGTSSWNALSGRLGMSRRNIRRAVSAALAHNAEGILLTDWGDNGHLQPWIVSLPPLVDTASLVKGEDLSLKELAKRLDLIMLTNGGGRLLIEYGKLHMLCGCEEDNSSPLFDIMLNGRKSRKFAKVGDEGVRRAIEAWKVLKASQPAVFTPGTPDWVKSGFATMDSLYSRLEAAVRD
ncbi:MAG: family 20 glycosylhydrolase [Kiritimatiellae bacterium]|nr:family 20 glycosylhydrolase [Kiritimatiellia bacterium]